MNRKEIIDMSNPDCPVRNVLARICDKWSVLVMLVLKDAEVMRFNEIQKSIPDISQKMLTVTLRTLEEDGFVKRKIYAEVPPKVEYSLTAHRQPCRLGKRKHGFHHQRPQSQRPLSPITCLESLQNLTETIGCAVH